MSLDGRYIPYLDDIPPFITPRWDEFDTYWKEVIITDQSGSSFTRETLVKEVADTDGGAHIDSALKENYVKLTRENSLKIKSVINGIEKDFTGIELAPLRQIAHEVLKTFE